MYFGNFSIIGLLLLNFYFTQVQSYADVLLFGNASQDADTGCIDPNCKHRPPERSYISSLFPKRKKVKNTCKHIVATLLTKFKLPDISMLLPQVAFTQNEVEYLLDKHNTNGKSQQIPKEAEKTIINLSFSEQQSIFEANEGYKNVQKWFLDKLTVVLVEAPCPRTSCMYT